MDRAQPLEEGCPVSPSPAGMSDNNDHSSPVAAGVPGQDPGGDVTPSVPLAVNDETAPSGEHLEEVPPASTPGRPRVRFIITEREEFEPVHSVFSKHQKTFIVLMVTLASFFSPLSGQIYYPVIPTLAQNYHLTNTLVNLTITTYLVLQGLAPAFLGTFADSGGRRPAYIIAFTVYTAANIGLALQSSFAALLVLRCLQSAGSSGTVSFGYGVIADIATPAERGKYIGPMAAGVMVAPALGPVIGGILARFLGWRSVFWFLVVISGGYLVAFVIAMPETARKIVGNGSVVPKEWWRMSLIQYITARRRRKESDPVVAGRGRRRGSVGSVQTGEQTQEASQEQQSSAKLKFPNPLESLVILLEKDALIIIWYVGLVMFANIALLTSTPNLFPKLYHFNDLQVGLCFLPLGIAACIAAIANGKVIDWNYARVARKLGFPVDRKKGDDLRNYPIESTRLQTVFPVMALGVAAFIPYGWTLQQGANLAAPLVLQFIIGFTFIASLNTLNTLLVDLFPDRAATAAAACNLVRCLLGAVGSAVIDPMLRGMGYGWCFAFLGILMGVAMGLLWMEKVYGMSWRERRFVKLEQRKRAEDSKADEEEAQVSTTDERGKVEAGDEGGETREITETRR